MFTIGVTGGIGSGKTTVTDLFANLGIGVVDSDSVARQIVAPGEPCLKQIIDHFGVELLLANGALNRSKLRNIIFTADHSLVCNSIKKLLIVSSH